MYSVPKPGYDPDTMRAVATAYRRERQARQLNEPASEMARAILDRWRGKPTQDINMGGSQTRQNLIETSYRDRE